MSRAATTRCVPGLRWPQESGLWSTPRCPEGREQYRTRSGPATARPLVYSDPPCHAIACALGVGGGCGVEQNNAQGTALKRDDVHVEIVETPSHPLRACAGTPSCSLHRSGPAISRYSGLLPRGFPSKLACSDGRPRDRIAFEFEAGLAKTKLFIFGFAVSRRLLAQVR